MSAVSAQISAIIHATEDPDRVKRVLDNLCPQDLFEAKTEKRTLKGHHGNEIVTVTVNIRGRFSSSFFQHLWTLLLTRDRVSILHDLESRIDDEGKLHIRLNKQEILRGKFLLGDRDPIKIQVTFRTRGGHVPELREQIQQLSEGPQNLLGNAAAAAANEG